MKSLVSSLCVLFVLGLFAVEAQAGHLLKHRKCEASTACAPAKVCAPAACQPACAQVKVCAPVKTCAPACKPCKTECQWACKTRLRWRCHRCH